MYGTKNSYIYQILNYSVAALGTISTFLFNIGRFANGVSEKIQKVSK